MHQSQPVQPRPNLSRPHIHTQTRVLRLPLQLLRAPRRSGEERRGGHCPLLASSPPSLSRVVAMATILENIQKARFLPTRPLRDDLPTFQGGKEVESHLMGLRKRLSSFSGKIQPISSASAEWAIRRTRSAPSLAAEFAGGPLKRWWDWGVGWLLSKKLACDLEMNEEEAAALGRHSRGTWAHALYKLRSGVRRLVVSDQSLPTTHHRKGAALPAASSAHHHCKPPAPQFAYTQSFQYGQAMAH